MASNFFGKKHSEKSKVKIGQNQPERRGEKNPCWKGGLSVNNPLEYQRIKQKEYRTKKRLRILFHYGGNPPHCECCGEKMIEFLAIDHINGGGNKHRLKIGGNRNFAGSTFYSWLIKNNFPEGFQILCHNCNSAKGFFGNCPHKKIKLPT